MKSTSLFRGKQSAWLPEHVQIAIARALLDFANWSSSETHGAVAEIVRRTHPALPMSRQELLAAVELVAARAPDLRTAGAFR